ncbi:hypothetical protein ACWGCW_14180 [Streptomyces sp. NPDC054933]
MDRVTLQDLQAVDPRALYFTPGGTLNPTSPDVAVEHFQRFVANLVLAPEVSDATRQLFARLCRVYIHGVLCYDLFTMVADDARLAFEQALRDRFMAYHGGVVDVRDKQGNRHRISATNYSQFYLDSTGRTPGLCHGRRQYSWAISCPIGHRPHHVEHHLSALLGHERPSQPADAENAMTTAYPC